MNLKRKLWWAQHRTDVYKYGTILSLVLIVTISIIYFTYSKFSSTSEVTAYETTVEPFIKNDYDFAPCSCHAKRIAFTFWPSTGTLHHHPMSCPQRRFVRFPQRNPPSQMHRFLWPHRHWKRFA